MGNHVNKIRGSRLFIDDKQTLGLRKAFCDMGYQGDFALVKLILYRPCNTCIRGRSSSLCTMTFIDSFFSSVTTPTKSRLHFSWLRLKTEVSSVLFDSKLENV